MDAGSRSRRLSLDVKTAPPDAALQGTDLCFSPCCLLKIPKSPILLDLNVDVDLCRVRQKEKRWICVDFQPEAKTRSSPWGPFERLRA